MIWWHNHYSGKMDYRGTGPVEPYVGQAHISPLNAQNNVNFPDFDRVELRVNGMWWRPYMQGRGR